MSGERRLQVLRAIVQDYVQTSEPVGSKAIVERHHLGVSAATVRNDMAVLEEEGLIHAPHTSAGRVPTDAGYRLFVDRLTAIKPLSGAERRAITQFLGGAVDLDDVVDRTVRLLASLTGQVAVVQYPSLRRSSVRHVELVPIGTTHVMVVLIVNTGRVEQRVIEVPARAEGVEDLLSQLRRSINEVAAGVPFHTAAAELQTLVDAAEPGQREVLAPVVAALQAALVEDREERVVLAGQANLTRSGADPRSLGPILEALEEHVVLLRLLGQGVGQGIGPGMEPARDTVHVQIGSENPVHDLQSTSLVTTGYGGGLERVAGLGVLGPTRMDYPSTMARVRAVATYVSAILDENDAG